ncbi:glycosyl hydrolase 115 family protein [Mucilaginibacter auburnensis]|uniref:Glycosyl hydrolase family 115 (Putative glucuronidase) n=1 Tax=Mucilaginibacter auburnensis TaxID=1457233 RepID=A0A2H9VNY2_9SPHI|nr:glycosyl hydrolase 115 family protein [Mucilaginibacter auburnensis]PJJ80021.1 glycosyl hydrolase family 115 (putative glucuronidase) [Mucilaginibacter auburnensis]
MIYNLKIFSKNPVRAFRQAAFILVLICATIGAIPTAAWALNGKNYISESYVKNAFKLSAGGRSATIVASSTDHKGVLRALLDLQGDIGKVTDHQPAVLYDKVPSQKELIIVGTIGKSALIDRLVKSGKLNVSAIKGKWENFLLQVIDDPFPGVTKAFVIAGSDKRGTIYGLYDVSSSIGVSPWHYWADVPPKKHTNLYIKSGRYSEGPSVKYRGIFINDEDPDLTRWVRENFGTVKPSTNPPVRAGVANYGHEFYAKVFELLLRIKANYLWPAMWSNAFNEDDAENPKLADEFGIVMGTSHQEPMLRSQQEWDRRYIRTLGNWDYTKHADTLAKFWREGISRNKGYESVITMGLRGANDTEMKGSLTDNIAMVEGIASTQQNIIKDEYGAAASNVPQVWCLYKEIMEYYNNGMRVPDNITLLWADDNWGNIRRLPDAKERLRAGGAGVYYHFDYHGDPRSYEWINTNPIAKIWDQMSLAKQYGADKIWIVNVGHFKGYELPMQYFMDLAWDTNYWTSDKIHAYTTQWAANQFGSQYAGDIADILNKYTKYNGRRKPESLTSSTYSLINYNEAENVVSDYVQLQKKAEQLYVKMPENLRDAYYQIVLFPVKACAQLYEMYLAAAKNELYAKQQRASANEMAARTRLFFQKDSLLMNEYNHVYAGGRWNHFMDETHIGYTTWSPPRKNSLDAIKLKELQVPQAATMGVALEGNENSWAEHTEQTVLPAFDNYNNTNHYLELFNKGRLPFNYTISSNVNWLNISNISGSVDSLDKRILFSLNKFALPKANAEGIVTISGTGQPVNVKVNYVALQTSMAKPGSFVESGGVIAIEAAHFAKNVPSGAREWKEIEDYGLTLSGMRATAPANAPAAVPGKNAPCLEYPLYLTSTDTAEITLITSPLLNVMPDRDIRIAVSFDDEAPIYMVNVPDKFKVHWSNPAWAQTVVKQARQVKTTLKIKSRGNHTLKVWLIDPGVVLEKIIVNTGGLKPSYLGPPESVSVPRKL